MIRLVQIIIQWIQLRIWIDLEIVKVERGKITMREKRQLQKNRINHY